MDGKLKINDFWAFIALDKDGTEGLIAVSHGLLMVPAVAADLERLNQLRPVVLLAAEVAGVKKVTLARFHNREDEEIVFERDTRDRCDR